MKLYRAKDYNEMSKIAANIIAAQVITKPDCVLGLATGSTPIGTYKKLVEKYENGDLDFSAVKGKLGYITMGTLWRVVIAPLIGLVGAVLLTNAGVISCGPGEYACFIALFGAPVAISSAIMAAEMDADAELARQLVVWTSVCPIVTVFAIVVIFRSAGLL